MKRGPEKKNKRKKSAKKKDDPMRKQKNQTTLHKKNKIKIKIAVTMVEDDNKNLEKTLNLKSTQMKGRKGHVKKKKR